MKPTKYYKIKETCLSCSCVWNKFWCTLTREKPFKCTICGGEVADREYSEWKFKGLELLEEKEKIDDPTYP